MTLQIKVEAGTPTFVAGYETTPWAAGGWGIAVPAGVQEGDLGFIVAGRDDGNAYTASDPAGWTRVIPDTVATNSNWRVLTRVREAGDSSTVTFGAGISGTVVAFWYRNARLGSVGSIWKRSGTVATITCPSLARSVTGSVLLAIAGDRSVATTEGEKGYTSVTGATYARRYEGNPTLASGTQISASFYAEIAPAGAPSDVVWTLNDSATNALGFQLELVPTGEWRKISQPKLKLTNVWRDASAVFTKVNGVWREVWPGAAGAVKIIGPVYQGEYVPLPGLAGSTTNLWYPGGCVRYDIVGDKSRIHSARVDMRFTPIAPKAPVEQTISWDITNDWGIYMVVWRVDATTVKRYYAGMTHVEAAAIVAPKYAVLLWSPREGGRFAYMPVCWDVSGLTTLPVRDDAAGGLDSHTGYAPFPPGVAASSSLNATGDGAYTVTNGYTDQEGTNGYGGYSSPNMASLTITLRDVNGTTLTSWGPSALAFTSVPAAHVPGLGIGPLSLMRTALRAESSVTSLDLYWPEEWQGLYDGFPSADVRFGRIVPDGNTAGSAEWWVFDATGERIGDFKLAVRKGVTDTVEVHGANIRPDLVGAGIMKEIVRYGTIWMPTRFVAMDAPGIGAYGSGPGLREIPDSVRDTYNLILNEWGWTKLEDAPNKSKSAAFYKVFDPRQTDRYLIYDTHLPMYNRFSELGLPPLEEVVQW